MEYTLAHCPIFQDQLIWSLLTTSVKFNLLFMRKISSAISGVRAFFHIRSVFVFVWVIIGCVILLANTSNFGLGIGPDGVKFVYGGRNLAATNEYRDELGDFITDAPPAYSLLISVGIRAGLSPKRSTLAVHFLSWATLLGLVANWARSALPRPGLRVVFMLGVVLSPALMLITARTLTELPYVTVSFAFLLAAAAYWRSSGLSALMAMALLGAVATLTRYIGVAEVATGAILVVLGRTQPLAAKLTHLVLYGLGSCVPFLLWMSRNWTVDGTIMGVRGSTIETFAGALNALRWTLSTWIAGQSPVALVLPLFLACGVMVAFRQRLGAVLADGVCRVSLIYLPTFILLVFYSATRTNIDELNQRLLAPAYIPALCVVIMAIASPTRRMMDRSKAEWPQWAIFGCLMIWIGLLTHQAFEWSRKAIADGVFGYNSRKWSSSSLVRAVDALPASAKLYSNVPWAFTYLTRHTTTPAPAKWLYRTRQEVPERLVMRPNRVGQPIYLIWSTLNAPDYFLSVDELSGAYQMQSIGQYDNGEIFLIVGTK